jgi:hypothetical protein
MSSTTRVSALIAKESQLNRQAESTKPLIQEGRIAVQNAQQRRAASERTFSEVRNELARLPRTTRPLVDSARGQLLASELKREGSALRTADSALKVAESDLHGNLQVMLELLRRKELVEGQVRSIQTSEERQVELRSDESLSELAALLFARREVAPSTTPRAFLGEGGELPQRSRAIEECASTIQQESALLPAMRAEASVKELGVPDPSWTLASPIARLTPSMAETPPTPATPMRAALPIGSELRVESMHSSIRLGESRVALSVEVSPGVRCGVELSTTTVGTVRVLLRPDGELDRRALQRDRALIREAFRARGIDVSELRIEQGTGV